MHANVRKYLANARLTFSRGFRHLTARWCARHSHQEIEIVYHARGRGVTTDPGGGHVEFRQGDAVIYGPDVAHDQALRGPGDDVCVHIAADPAPPPQLSGTMLVKRVDAQLSRELIELSRMPSDLPWIRKLTCDHRAAATLIALLERAESGRPGASVTPGDRYAAAAYEYVQARPDGIASIRDVATAVGIGYDHLRHAFKRRYGMSIKRWQLEMRVRRAKDLLANTTVPLKQIAQTCGFATERYFSTNFRKLAGVTPGGYRRSHGA